MKKLIHKLFGKYFSEKEVEELLSKQREICGEKMDEWCRYNNLKECGHIVQYSCKPEFEDYE